MKILNKKNIKLFCIALSIILAIVLIVLMNTERNTLAARETIKLSCPSCGDIPGGVLNVKIIDRDENYHFIKCSNCFGREYDEKHKYGWEKIDETKHIKYCKVESCGHFKQENHTYGTDDICDGCNYRRASRDYCPKSSNGRHNYGNNYTYSGTTTHKMACLACGYTKTENHTSNPCPCGYDTTCKHPNFRWTYDSTVKNPPEHYKQCTTCRVKLSSEPHTYNGNTCSRCQHTKECAHSDTSDRKKDENVHYKICNACSVVVREEPHIYSGNTCIPCGHIKGCEHPYLSDWKGASSYHYKECRNCVTVVEIGDHIYDSSGKCEVCDWQKLSAGDYPKCHTVCTKCSGSTYCPITTVPGTVVDANYSCPGCIGHTVEKKVYTCPECGFSNTNYWCNGYDAADGRCGCTEGIHQVSATKHANAPCPGCNGDGYTTINHAWIIARIQNPTCTTPGEEEVECRYCGETDSNTIPATGIHAGASHANGGKCTSCNTVYEQHNQSTTIDRYEATPATHTTVYKCSFAGCTATYTGTPENHTWNNATGECTECGYSCGHTGATHANGGKCTTCNNVYEQHGQGTTIASYDKVPATHTPVYKCSFAGCTATYTGTPENHTWNATTGACTQCDYTCTHNGATTGTCSTCGKTLSTPTPECTHGTTEWKKNETEHWKKCSNASCGKEITGTRENHDWSNRDGECLDCDYRCTHNGATTGTCSTCGKTLTETKPECTHGNTILVDANSEYHWVKCEDCDKILKQEEHTYVSGTCECGRKQEAESKECEHKNREWKSDENEHWQVCKDCGEEISGTRAKHSMKDGECKNCGRKDTTSTTTKLPNTGSETIVIFAIVLLGLVTFGAIKLKKYRDI